MNLSCGTGAQIDLRSAHASPQSPVALSFQAVAIVYGGATGSDVGADLGAVGLNDYTERRGNRTGWHRAYWNRYDGRSQSQNKTSQKEFTHKILQEGYQSRVGRCGNAVNSDFEFDA
jgi:hypothetical protein